MYFDPGFGSMIIQLIVAGIAAAGVAWGVMKIRLKGLFKKNTPQQTDAEQEDVDEQL